MFCVLARCRTMREISKCVCVLARCQTMREISKCILCVGQVSDYEGDK